MTESDFLRDRQFSQVNICGEGRKYNQLALCASWGRIEYRRPDHSKCKKEENILFVHTGGSPALYIYMKEVLE